MPRSKTGNKREAVDVESLKAAVNDVLSNNMSNRDAANLYNVTKSTLCRHVKFHRESGKPTFEYSTTNAVKQIFSIEEERQLADYMNFSARLHYGLNKIEARVLAFQYAKKNVQNTPD